MHSMDKYRPTHPDDSEGYTSHFKNVFAGSLSSAISRFIGHPLDVLKVRFQLQQQFLAHAHNESVQIQYRSIAHAFKLIYREEGVRGLWRSHNVSQFQGFFQGVTQFWTFEQIHTLLYSSPLATLPHFCNFAAGALTGTIIVLTLSPMDMLRTRTMARSATGIAVPIPKAAVEIYAAGGVRSFYSGCTTSIIHLASLMGCKFMFYNIYCDFGLHVMKETVREDLPGPILVAAGAASGFSSNFVTYPLDLVKRRMQIHAVDGHNKSPESICRAIVQCVKLVVRYEGVFGLFKGFVPCVIKSAVSTSVQFSAFDKLRKFADDFF